MKISDKIANEMLILIT